MITTPEEYYKYLWEIESQRPLLKDEVTANMDPSILAYLELLGINIIDPMVNDEGQVIDPTTGEVVMINTNPMNNRPLLSIILPTDERTFNVNMATRTIEVPTFLSVAKDHKAETIYFLVDRYYEYKDLAETSCVIEYINAEGEGGFYIVPFYDITSYQGYIDEYEEHTNKMLIPWCIDGGVTKTAGTVQFAIRFYELDEGTREFTYNIRTKIATAEVLNGINESELDKDIDYNIMSNLVQDFNEKIENHEHIVYWTDL